MLKVLSLDEIKSDPQAQVTLLHACVILLNELVSIEQAREQKKVFMPQRITINPNSTYLFDVGLIPAMWKVSISESTGTNPTILEVHHGEFAGITPLEVLGSGDFFQFPANNSRLLLRNVGLDAVTLTVVAENESVFTKW